MRPLLSLLRSALPVILLMDPVMAVAQDAGLDWRSVPWTKSKVFLTHPFAAGDGTYAYAATPNYSSTRHLARYPTPDSKLDRATIFYIELSPGYHFPASYHAKEVLEWKSIKSVTRTRQEILNIPSKRGAMNIAKFTIEGGTECFTLAQTWGQSGTMTTSEGTNRLIGYICQQPGLPLIDSWIKSAVDAIHVRE